MANFNNLNSKSQEPEIDFSYSYDGVITMVIMQIKSLQTRLAASLDCEAGREMQIALDNYIKLLVNVRDKYPNIDTKKFF